MTELTTDLTQAFNTLLPFVLPLADRLPVDMALYLIAALVARVGHRHMWLVYLIFALAAGFVGHH